MNRVCCGLLMRSALITAVICSAGIASAVTLQNGTATFSQSFDRAWSPAEAIDGNFAGANGWAIFNTSSGTNAQTAVWETASDFSGSGLSISMAFNYGDRHLLGRFRISATTDDRSLFADGLGTGGDVTANWTVLNASGITLPAGLTSSILGDGSILVGGSVPNTGTYDVQFSQALVGVTGLRLEAMEDGSLPTDGPGLQPNGNFVLTEFTANPVPEPSSVMFVGFGAVAFAMRRRR